MAVADERPGLWQVAGASVRGANHVRLDLPNQDASKWALGPGQQSFALAVADGHGASPHPRSSRGAQIAVTLAVDEILAPIGGGGMFGAGPDFTSIPENLLVRWREVVRADIAKHPFTAAESASLAPWDLDGTGAYGSTLLVFLATASCGFAFQVGDGDIYIVGSNGTVTTVFERPEYPGEATYSLCMPDALDVVQTRSFSAIELRTLVAVAVTTDGYDKSFRDDISAAEQIKNMSERLRWDAAAAMIPDLERWLGRVTEAGSGDDISVVIAARRSGGAD